MSGEAGPAGGAPDLAPSAMTTPSDGLSEREARARLATYGPNVARAAVRRGVVVEYLLHFRNPLVLLLLAASVVLGWTGEATSMTIIVVIVLASVTLDFLQEHRAERALARLQATVAATAIVMRNGAPREVRVADIVPGDVAQVSAGDVVPADGALLDADRLFANEAALTGESFPVEKRADADAGSERRSVRMGSSIASGTGRFLVERTGPATALGSMVAELASDRPEPPLERGARRFGMMILRLTLFLVLFVVLVNAAFHRPWLESFLFAVALAVGLTPELLPMIVSVTLARGALRLARGHVVVKRPSAIYALGSIDVLCSDKTGTLTEARIRFAGAEGTSGEASAHVAGLARINSRFASGVRSPLDDALLADVDAEATGFRKLDELAFDFVRRLVSVLAVSGSEVLLVVKGAPEDVIARCTRIGGTDGASCEMTAAHAGALTARFHALGEQGLRVLAVATRTLEPRREHLRPDDESDLAFEGFVTFLDPPRPDAAHAIASLARAGIGVKILTGDNERVARHVCATLGVDVGDVLTGRDIEALADDALASAAVRAALFARVSPAQKTRVVHALRSRGHVVGFLGDGINDAPAMHAADVGISVQGAAGVAREAADVILTRGRLGVIRDGVLEGRRTYANIMKYLMMATSSNFGNMLSMAAATLFLPFLPMLPVQILLNNLLYDVSETAIPFDRVDETELRRPHVWDMREIRHFMLVLGPVSSLFDFLTFGVLLLLGAGAALFQTGWFVESIATQVLVIFVIRTRHDPLKSRPHPLLVSSSLGVLAIALVLPFTPAGPLLGFVAPPPAFFAVLVLLVAVYLALVQLVKKRAFRAQHAWRQRTHAAAPAGARIR
jgi:Mg2+-importing ATPase